MTRDAGRPLRADAQRNRDKILAAAVRVFTEEGLDAHFERIAKEAGVGTGTLYRNFPTREALIEAAYRNEVARLCDAVPGLLAAMSPPQALRAWTRRFIDYATAKLGMADALRAVVNSGTNPYADSHEMIQAALSPSWTPIPLPERSLAEPSPLGQGGEHLVEPGRVLLHRSRRGRTGTSGGHRQPPAR